MKSQNLKVRTKGKEAVVQTAIKTFSVTNAFVKDRTSSSPVELLMSSLGS